MDAEKAVGLNHGVGKEQPESHERRLMGFKPMGLSYESVGN
jgi:hypothetical protein